MVSEERRKFLVHRATVQARWAWREKQRAKQPPPPKLEKVPGYRWCPCCKRDIPPRATFDADSLPLHVDAYQGAAEVTFEDRKVSLPGNHGRILSELVACEGAVGWELIARSIWQGPMGDRALRSAFGERLGVLRERLRSIGVEGLVLLDGTGVTKLAVPGIFSLNL